MRRALLLIVLSVAVLAPVAWVTAHVLGKRRVPPPLWTERDLPPLPSPGDNGRVLFEGAPEGGGGTGHAAVLPRAPIPKRRGDVSEGPG